MRFLPSLAGLVIVGGLAMTLVSADDNDTRAWADARAQVLAADDPRLRLSQADSAAYDARYGQQSPSPEVAKALGASDDAYHARRSRRAAEAVALCLALLVGIALFARQWRRRAPPLKTVLIVIAVVAALAVIAAFIVATLAGSAIHG